jgi:hypothetical protein
MTLFSSRDKAQLPNFIIQMPQEAVVNLKVAVNFQHVGFLFLAQALQIKSNSEEEMSLAVNLLPLPHQGQLAAVETLPFKCLEKQVSQRRH